MKTDYNDNYLVDLDGTLIQGGAPLPGARRFFQQFGDRSAIVSNNSTHTAESLAKQLGACNVPILSERIITAGEQSLMLIARRYRDARVLLAASDDIRRRAVDLGIDIVAQRADVVLVCRDTAFSYDKLQRIVSELARGAKLIAANPDLSHPGAGGIPVPETGALLAAIESCCRIKASHVVGKPGPDLFLAALDRFNWKAKHTWVIGDNELTDIQGASLLGMRSVLVGPTARIESLEALNTLLGRGRAIGAGADLDA